MKKTTIPFIPTHLISAELKGASLADSPVMAVFVDGVTRLYDASEASSGETPEWRVVAPAPLTTHHVLRTGTDGVRVQRNRKDMAKATVTRIGADGSTDVLYFQIVDGELVAVRAAVTHVETPVETPVEETPSTDPLPAHLAKAMAPVDRILDDARPAFTEAKPKKSRAKKTPTETTLPSSTVAVAPAPVSVPVAPTSTPTTNGTSNGAKKHREGSVQGMTVEELREEFTRKTGLPAPSNSLHYMRKMLLAARRGRTDFRAKREKVPTLVLTLEEARALASGDVKVGTKITEFVRANSQESASA